MWHVYKYILRNISDQTLLLYYIKIQQTLYFTSYMINFSCYLPIKEENNKIQYNTCCFRMVMMPCCFHVLYIIVIEHVYYYYYHYIYIYYYEIVHDVC